LGVRALIRTVSSLGLFLVPSLGLAAPSGEATDNAASVDSIAPASELHAAEQLATEAATAYQSKDRTEQERALVKFRAASRAFLRVLEHEPDATQAEAAARGQMLALRSALEYREANGRAKACRIDSAGACVYREKRKTKVRSSSKVEPKDAFEPTEYSADERAMLDAYDVYDRNIDDPDDPLRPGIEYHRAKLAMMHSRFDEAVPQLESVLREHDGSVYAAWSAEMLIDVLAIRWTGADTEEGVLAAEEKLEAWCRKIQSMQAYEHRASKPLRSAVPTLLSGIGWKKAERYMQQGREGDRDAFSRCGEQYLSVWLEFEVHDRADMLLFNGARCFEAGLKLGKAIRTRKQLLARYPDSAVYQQTLRDLAENYSSIASYREAADHLEEYSLKYAKDSYAAEAIERAALFRVGLDEPDKAAENLDRFGQLYRRKNPKLAAEALWRRGELAGSDDARLEHARTYLAQYGKHGAVDRRLIAEATIGQILWRQSCKHPGPDDTCVTVEPRRARGKARHCGADSAPTNIRVHSRDVGKATRARAHFQAALELAERKVDIPRDDDQRRRDYDDAIAMSMVYLADRSFEEYLALEPPKDARPGQPELTEFVSRKVALGQTLADKYAKVKEAGSDPWTVTAAARKATLSRRFADQLRHARVPRRVEAKPFCRGMAALADDPAQRAVEAYAECVDESTKRGYFNADSRRCEQALHELAPNEYPATHEMFGGPRYTRPVLDVVGVQTHLPECYGRCDLQ